VLNRFSMLIIPLLHPQSVVPTRRILPSFPLHLPSQAAMFVSTVNPQLPPHVKMRVMRVRVMRMRLKMEMMIMMRKRRLSQLCGLAHQKVIGSSLITRLRVIFCFDFTTSFYLSSLLDMDHSGHNASVTSHSRDHSVEGNTCILASSISDIYHQF